MGCRCLRQLGFPSSTRGRGDAGLYARRMTKVPYSLVPSPGLRLGEEKRSKSSEPVRRPNAVSVADADCEAEARDCRPITGGRHLDVASSPLPVLFATSLSPHATINHKHDL